MLLLLFSVEPGPTSKVSRSKAAAGGLPRSVRESVSAFANARGGMIILGLSDGDFQPVPIDSAKLASDLASACANEVEPPIRAEVDVARVDGRPVVVAQVDELSVGRKPCFVKSKGIEGGSFVRTHDGDRRLTSYEVHILVAGRGQPLEDMAPVKGAGRGDLDDRLVASLLQRVRARRGPSMAAHDDIDVLRMLGVMVGERDDLSVTLAGLMSLGRYPQQFLPQVNVSLSTGRSQWENSVREPRVGVARSCGLAAGCRTGSPDVRR